MKTSGLRKKYKRKKEKRDNISQAEFNKIKKDISKSFKQMTKK